jgi:probable rRNA maturation factor
LKDGGPGEENFLKKFSSPAIKKPKNKNKKGKKAMKQRKIMIYFLNDQEKYEITYKQKILVRRAVEATLEYEGYQNNAEISVTFTDNEKIQKINNEFRGIDKPTDVLSFPLTDYESSNVPFADELDGSLGDIVISLERAEEQANEFGHSFEREIAFLTVHSMLHLLGYDHVNSEEEELVMRRKQSDVLKNMGLDIK